MFFQVFGVQRPPRRALGGPRRLPRGTQRAPKPNKKGIQKWTPKIINFWTNFWTILGAILGPEFAPKGDPKWDHFCNPLPPALRVGGLRFCELNGSAAKATVTGIILGKRKGTILGTISGLHWPRRGQDGTKRAIKSCKDPKTCIC